MRLLTITAANRSSENVDASSPKVLIVWVTSKPGGSKIHPLVSTIWKRPIGMHSEESPEIKVLYSTIPMKKVSGTALAKANHHQPIPIQVAKVRFAIEQVRQVVDRNPRKPAEMVQLKPFKRTIHHIAPPVLGVLVHIGKLPRTDDFSDIGKA